VRARLLLCLSLVAWLTPAAAHADWLLTPFIGVKFAGATSFVDLEKGAGATKLTLGGSAALLGRGLFGVEVDVGYSPRFFERSNRAGLVRRSSVTTLMGSVIVAAPLGLTRESLRPYLAGGLGLIHAETEDVLDVLRIDSNLFGMTLGGGVIGSLSERTSLRIDLRHFRTLSRHGEPVLGSGASRLSFWRASAGVTLRY
jgi:opacity protein-like surface antigen